MRARPPGFSLTKIVATLGPASDSPPMVRRLIEAGVSVFRLNFSHGKGEDHARRLRVVREQAEELGRSIAVLGDLPGPKIRVGHIPGEGVELAPGSLVVFRPSATEVRSAPEENAIVLPTTYPTLSREVAQGQRILINDGAIRMLVVECARDGSEALCRVTVGGLVTSGKGINLPETRLSAPSLTDQDRLWAAWAVEHAVDFLALSFVRKPEDIRALREFLDGVCPVHRQAADSAGPSAIPIVAKIEKPQAVESLDEIAREADALMVARGDLGVEMDIAQVPIVQKRVIRAAQGWGKPCIVATQMLESMITSAMPTRAEASDVANAVFDEADALMLSGESAVGKHPALVVETMRRIIITAERSMDEAEAHPSPPSKLVESGYRTAALAHGAWEVARDTGAVAIVCWSQNAGTSRYLSQNNFRVPIVAFSSDARATRRMALQMGVWPVRSDPPADGRIATWREHIDRLLLRRGLASPGDAIVVVAGEPLGRIKATDSVIAARVGDTDPADDAI